MPKSSNFLAFVMYACGWVADKHRVMVCVSHLAIHRLLSFAQVWVDKARSYTPALAQSAPGLSAFYQQYYTIIQSVIFRLLHTIHTPYKNYYKEYIGVY